MTQIVLELDDTEMGPKLRACQPKQRAFIYALVEAGGNATRAAMAAGYGEDSKDADARRNACRSRGYQLLREPKILEAIKEVAQQRLDYGGLIATSVVLEIAMDPLHKQRLKAAEVLLDRSGLIVKQEINVNHLHEINDKSTRAQIESILDMARGLNMDPRPLLAHAGVQLQLTGPDTGNIQDAEFEVVEDWSVEPGEVEEQF